MASNAYEFLKPAGAAKGKMGTQGGAMQGAPTGMASGYGGGKAPAGSAAQPRANVAGTLSSTQGGAMPRPAAGGMSPGSQYLGGGSGGNGWGAAWNRAANAPGTTAHAQTQLGLQQQAQQARQPAPVNPPAPNYDPNQYLPPGSAANGGGNSGQYGGANPIDMGQYNPSGTAPMPSVLQGLTNIPNVYSPGTYPDKNSPVSRALENALPLAQLQANQSNFDRQFGEDARKFNLDFARTDRNDLLGYGLDARAANREDWALANSLSQWNRQFDRGNLEADRRFGLDQSMNQAQINELRGRLGLDTNIANMRNNVDMRGLDIQNAYNQGRLSLDQAQQLLDERLGMRGMDLQQQQIGNQMAQFNKQFGLDSRALAQEAALSREQMANQLAMSRMAQYGRNAAPVQFARSWA